jgi:hypothetical protein
MSDDDKVGYGRPPKAHRFKKGQSGNPHGSSKKARKRQQRQFLPFDDVILDDAGKQIRIRQGNRTSTISMKEALLQKQYSLALGGNRVALKNSLDQIAKAEKNKLERVLELYETFVDYKENYPANAKSHRARGLGLLLPHPDDIQLDPYTGEVTTTGPQNEKELARLKKILEGREFFMSHHKALRKDFAECAEQGWSRPASDGEIVTRLKVLLDHCDSELAQRGWLPRVAGVKESKAS